LVIGYVKGEKSKKKLHTERSRSELAEVKKCVKKVYSTEFFFVTI